MASRQPPGSGARSPAGQEGFLLGGLCLQRSEALAVSSAGIDGVVVQRLRDENHVGDAKVAPNCDSGGCEVRDERACYTETVGQLGGEPGTCTCAGQDRCCDKVFRRLILVEEVMNGLKLRTSKVCDITEEPNEEETH